MLDALEEGWGLDYRIQDVTAWKVAPAVAAQANERRAKGPVATEEYPVMQDPRLTAQLLIARDEQYLHELWLHYWANGGQAQLFEFEAYLYGMIQMCSSELQIVRWAIEEVNTQARPE